MKKLLQEWHLFTGEIASGIIPAEFPCHREQYLSIEAQRAELICDDHDEKWFSAIGCTELATIDVQCESEGNLPQPSKHASDRGRPRENFSDPSKKSKRRRLPQFFHVDDI